MWQIIFISIKEDNAQRFKTPCLENAFFLIYILTSDLFAALHAVIIITSNKQVIRCVDCGKQRNKSNILLNKSLLPVGALFRNYFLLRPQFANTIIRLLEQNWYLPTYNSCLSFVNDLIGYNNTKAAGVFLAKGTLIQTKWKIFY